MTSQAPSTSLFPDSLIGRVIDGRYRVRRPIGKGSMGIVYEAEHVLIGRKVALKFANPNVSSASVERFHREAQAAAAVGNEHVVHVMDMGRLENGAAYIVLEHLEGVDLGFAVATQGRFSLQRALHVVCQLCDALSAVHAAGIVHRDLKPENIFLISRERHDDFVKVLDFGVCKFNEPGRSRLTATGDTIGTPQFMAPEQVEGRSDVDHRADIYAIAAILYFLLTDKTPFEASTLPQLFLEICHKVPPGLKEVPGIPAGLENVVHCALRKDPARRFQTCEALKVALLPFTGRIDEFATTIADLPSARPGETPTFADETLASFQALGLERSWFKQVWPLAGALLVVVSSLGLAYALRADPLATDAQPNAGSQRFTSASTTPAGDARPSSELSPPETLIAQPAPDPRVNSAPSAPVAAKGLGRRSQSAPPPPVLQGTAPAEPAPTADTQSAVSSNQAPETRGARSVPFDRALQLPLNRPLKDGL